MNEELNLVEILKNVPSGTKLWSCISGDIEFESIDYLSPKYPIKTSTDTFTSDGKFYDDRGECTLFPSKYQRDWSKFKVDLPIDTTMMVCDNDTNDWSLRYYAGNKKCWSGGNKSTNNNGNLPFEYMVPVSDFDFTNPESNINKSI